MVPAAAWSVPAQVQSELPVSSSAIVHVLLHRLAVVRPGKEVRELLAHPTRENGFVLAVFFRFSYVNGGAFCRCQSCVPAVSSLSHDRVLAMPFAAAISFFCWCNRLFVTSALLPAVTVIACPGVVLEWLHQGAFRPTPAFCVFSAIFIQVSRREFSGMAPSRRQSLLCCPPPASRPSQSVPPPVPTNPCGATNPCTVSPPPGERPLLGAGVVPPGRPRLLPVFARRDPRGVHRGLPPAAVSRRGVLVAGRHADVRRRSPVPGLEVPAVSVPGRGVGAGAIRGGRGVRAPR